ncbi:MAG: cobalamin biosynthesis protein [Chloroflexota bacterium]|nr:cobalamin biosynthesis protein [Chloroflexota bacterium]
MDYVAILLLALALDIVFGELPNQVHPVAAIGRVISWQLRFAPKNNKEAFFYGIFIALFTIAIFSVPIYILLWYLRDINAVLFVLVGAVCLKNTFSLKELGCAARRVQSPLRVGELTKAREAVGRIVSRNTSCLERDAVVAATIESVSENTSDSFVAPLFYFLLLGVPGALAYRVANTLDAMVGYHGEYEYLGKFSARMDDILNYIPSRISGLLVVLVANLARGSMARAWHVMWRDHANTESPNAGWTMSATAGALGLRLEKEGQYSLGDTIVPVSVEAISQGVRIMWLSACVWTIVCSFITWMVLA